jgi:hypothetical protein
MARETDEGTVVDSRPTEPPPPGAVTRRPRDPLRSARLLVPIAAIAVGLLVGINMLPDGSALPLLPTESGSPAVYSSEPGVGYLVDRPELARRVALAAAGQEPYASSVADLLAWAPQAIDEVARPVQPLVIEDTEGPFVQDARRATAWA